MDPRRALPAIERVIAALADDQHLLPQPVIARCARDAVEAARVRVGEGIDVDVEDVLTDARARARVLALRLLQPVVNATGVIVHTNLGRAPLGEPDLAEAVYIASGYSNLEYRLDEGRRGSRHDHAGNLLALACGAESGLVVNNNAAAVLLALGALARGKEVVVSRGELVEIGGGFRVPEIMAESGCRLVEVGTTNRTRLDDYRAATGPETALLLKVHASNYRMVGFTETTPVAALAGLGPPVMVDAGSGLLDERTPWLGHRPPWLADEPGIRQALDDGADVVTFSGDKLLGGPQAGIILGRTALVDRIARHPLARAVRADKLTLAALQHVALAYLTNEAARLPLWRMATAPLDDLRARAEEIAQRVPGAKVVASDAVAGGGSLPGLTIPSVGVAMEVDDPNAVLADLHERRVVARIVDDAVLADVRTVEPADDTVLADALRDATASRPARP